MTTTWWTYYPDDDFVQFSSREEARVDLQGDDFLYDSGEWREDMPHVCVIRCDKLVPALEYSGDKHDWIIENGTKTDIVKEIVIAEKPDDPEPPLSLLAPWRQNQLDDWIDDWWDRIWPYSKYYDRIVSYKWQPVNSDERIIMNIKETTQFAKYVAENAEINGREWNGVTIIFHLENGQGGIVYTTGLLEFTDEAIADAIYQIRSCKQNEIDKANQN